MWFPKLSSQSIENRVTILILLDLVKAPIVAVVSISVFELNKRWRFSVYALRWFFQTSDKCLGCRQFFRDCSMSVACISKGFVSSAELAIWLFSNSKKRSIPLILNNNGPKIEPDGALYSVSCLKLKKTLILICWVRFLKYEESISTDKSWISIQV